MQNYEVTLCVCISCSVVSESLWTVAHQAPLSVEFSRQEYWSGLPSPSPRDLPDPGIKPGSPALQAESLPSEPPGKPQGTHITLQQKKNNPDFKMDKGPEQTFLKVKFTKGQQVQEKFQSHGSRGKCKLKPQYYLTLRSRRQKRQHC